MDDNTLKFALALLGVLQVSMLGYFTYRQNVAAGKLREVHELVNGMSHEKTDAVADAAGARGELVGRDFEAGRVSAMAELKLQVDTNALHIAALRTGGVLESGVVVPVRVVPDPEHPVPVVVEEHKP